MVVSNPRLPDNPIEVANAAFCALTGYPESEVVGRNCRFLTGNLTQRAVTEQIRASIRAQRPVLADILNFRRDGSAFRNGVMITPLFDDDGKLEWFLGSQVDLGEAVADPLSKRRTEAVLKVADASDSPARGARTSGARPPQQADRLGAEDQREDGEDASRACCSTGWAFRQRPRPSASQSRPASSARQYSPKAISSRRHRPPTSDSVNGRPCAS